MKKLAMLMSFLILFLSLSFSSYALEDNMEVEPQGIIGPHWEWRVRSVTNLSDRYTSWQTKASHNQPVTVPTGFELTCSFTQYVSNSLSGSLKVSKGVIDATVGYSTDWGTSKTVTGGFTIPYGYAGRLKVREVYSNRKSVKQQLYHLITLQWMDDVAYVTTEKWSHFDFQEEIWKP